MECQPPSTNSHKYIIIIVDYFTKWDEAMPSFNNTTETTTRFLFNHIIAHFDVPKQLVLDHGTHFQNHLFENTSRLLGFTHNFATHYYPKTNSHIEVATASLKPCSKGWLTNIKPIGIVCSSLLYEHIKLPPKQLSVLHPSTFSTKLN